MTIYGRNKESEQYWFIMVIVDGFESIMLVHGTYTEMWNYMKNAFNLPIHYRYRQASDEEVAMAKRIGIKAYIC